MIKFDCHKTGALFFLKITFPLTKLQGVLLRASRHRGDGVHPGAEVVEISGRRVEVKEGLEGLDQLPFRHRVHLREGKLRDAARPAVSLLDLRLPLLIDTRLASGVRCAQMPRQSV